jgi:transcriptional regulator with XRE-family HTH domain
MSNKLGEYLKNLRAQKKKSLRQVENETKISNAHLSQIEKGVIEKPAIDLLEKLATYYHVELSYLKILAGYLAQQQNIEADSRLTPLKFVTATQLDSFATTKEAEGLLPELIRDLIVSTVRCEYLEMPIGGSIFMHGWDGLLKYKKKPNVQFVPQGFSCWEMSKAKKVSRKSEEDFQKRTKKPLGQTVENSTYIQVSFKRVSKIEKAKIIANAKSTAWKSVKVIDAEDLELWLERNPVLALSYAKKMGLFPSAPGLLPLNDFWGQWWSSTDPAIDQSLLLEAGRRCDGAKEFVIAETLDHLKIKSNSIPIGLAFFYAIAAAQENQTISQSLISRSIIVENEDAFRLISSRGKHLVLIPTFKGAPIGEAKLNGHRIVSIVNNFNPTDLDSVGRVRTSVMSDFLKIEGGYSDEKAYRIAKSCYGNLSVLRLMLADEGEAAYPSWSRPDFGNAVLPMVMLGGWNANNEADRNIVQSVAQKTYQDSELFLESIPEDNANLFHRINHQYSFYQEYCYVHLSKYLTDRLLDNFFAAAKEVLCTLNSKYELDPNNRFAADLYNKGQRYSGKLRVGIATSLAMLANMNLSSLPHIQLRIDNLIDQILGDESDWKFWASLSDIMMLLAEASPTAFLNKLETVCRKEEFVEIFNQTTTMGGCDYSSILWSLESCAWERKHFKQVSRILMFLADRENRKNNYVNQPSNSLWDIHRVWANQSALQFKERMLILKELEEVNPVQTWRLLLRLVPKPHETGSYTYRPRFREIEFESQSKEADADYVTVMNAIIDYVLNFLSNDKTKWIDVLDLMFSIRPQSYQIRLIDNFFR